MIQVSSDGGGTVSQFSCVQFELGELKVANEVGHACLAAVGLRQVRQGLTPDPALHRRRSQVSVVLVGELGVAQPRLGTKVVALLGQQALRVLRVTSVLKIAPLAVQNLAREASG